MHKISGCLMVIFSSLYAQAQNDTILAQMPTPDSALNQLSAALYSNSNDVYIGKTIQGTASFYSLKFEGRKTATGEIFRHTNYTCASNNFKLNTWIKVDNLGNGKSVVVRVNDRMHQNMKKKGRVVDLTRAAAKKIGIMRKGLAKVRVEVVNRPK